MAGNFLTADISAPDLSRYQTTQQKLDAMENYLFLLLENLRYALRNLNPYENFNQTELEAWADTLKANVVITKTLITNELYAQYGSIADLVVDELRTDYKRAQRYLAGDTSNLDYIHVHDDCMKFITSRTDGSQAVQMNFNGRPFWWTDETRTQMTMERETKWPVMVYVYTEEVKASFKFQPVANPDGTAATFPTLTMGVGTDPTGQSGNGQATIKKHFGGLDIVYRTSMGKNAGVHFRDDGFVDVVQRRASITVDTQNNTIVVRPEGELADSYAINYNEDEAGNLDLIWPDGYQTRVEVL